MKKIWFVSPVYYDVASFLELKEEILKQFPNANFVVLDDSAGQDPDINTLKTEANISLVTPPFNLGHQRGLVFALRSLLPHISDQDIVVTMDSDGEDRPQDVPELIDKIRTSQNIKHSVALVQRSKRKESLTFKAFYLVYKMAFYWLTGTVIRSGNFACFYGSFLKNYIRHPYFDLCYSSTLVSLKIERLIIEKPRGTRLQGQSKMNFTSLVMHGIRMLMPFIDRIAIRSLVAFAGLFVLSIIFASVVISVKYMTDLAIPGWASYLVMMSIMMSLINLGNFLVLFSIFSQSQGIAMQRLEGNIDEESSSDRTILSKTS